MKKSAPTLAAVAAASAIQSLAAAQPSEGVIQLARLSMLLTSNTGMTLEGDFQNVTPACFREVLSVLKRHGASPTQEQINQINALEGKSGIVIA